MAFFRQRTQREALTIPSQLEGQAVRRQRGKPRSHPVMSSAKFLPQTDYSSMLKAYKSQSLLTVSASPLWPRRKYRITHACSPGINVQVKHRIANVEIRLP